MGKSHKFKLDIFPMAKARGFLADLGESFKAPRSAPGVRAVRYWMQVTGLETPVAERRQQG